MSKKIKESEKIKSPFMRYSVTVVSCLLLLGFGFLFLMFGTDNIYNINENLITNRQISRDTSVSSVVNTIDNMETSSNVRVPGIDYVPNGAWYESVPANMYTPGNVVDTIQFSDGAVNIYDGLPWAADGDTYIVNSVTAASDTIKYIDYNSGLTSGLSTNYTYAYEMSSKSCVYQLDGVNCLAFAPLPIVVDRNYNSEFNTPDWYQASTPSRSIYGYGTRKYCVILRRKSDGKTVYMPLVAKDAKGHTFPGGTMQTHVQLVNGTSSLGPFTVNIGDTGTRNTVLSWSEFVTGLDTIVGEPAQSNLKLRAYVKVCLEIYGGNSSDCKALSDFEIIGFVAW